MIDNERGRENNEERKRKRRKQKTDRTNISTGIEPHIYIRIRKEEGRMNDI